MHQSRIPPWMMDRTLAGTSRRSLRPFRQFRRLVLISYRIIRASRPSPTAPIPLLTVRPGSPLLGDLLPPLLRYLLPPRLGNLLPPLLGNLLSPCPNQDSHPPPASLPSRGQHRSPERVSRPRNQPSSRHQMLKAGDLAFSVMHRKSSEFHQPRPGNSSPSDIASKDCSIRSQLLPLEPFSNRKWRGA